MIGSIAPFHYGCVACRSIDIPGDLAAMVLLLMYVEGTSFDEIKHDLCFHHRRELQICSARKERA
jgi:hypothetical protein